MGTGFLLDSNTVIDFIGAKLPLDGQVFVSNIPPLISVITRIEIFASANIPQAELTRMHDFAAFAQIINLIDDKIVAQAIQIRQSQKIKLPDAIIAATAMVNNLTLITRNTTDFKDISGLRLINPWEL